MAKIKTVQDTKVKEKKPFDFMAFICGAWLITITAIMPIFLSDAYARVLQDKYGMLLVASGILVGCFVIWALFDNRIKNYFDKAKSYANPETGKWLWNWCKATFNCMDVCVIVFAITVVISTLLSTPYMYQCFFGNEGRYCGALFWMVLIIDYFIISRNLKFRASYVTIFLIAGLLVAILSILHYFNIDPLFLKYYMSESSWNIFTSTIGNINSFSAFICIPIAISASLFITMKNSNSSVILNVLCLFIMTASIITAGSDNGYIALGVLLLALPFFALESYSGTKKLLVSMAICISAMEIVVICNSSFADSVIYLSGGLFGVFEKTEAFCYLIIVLLVVAGIMAVYERKAQTSDKEIVMPKTLKCVWGIIVGIILTLGIVVVIVANTNFNILPNVFKPFEGYLVFNDEWGIWRAYVWKLLIKLYSELPCIHKLFGTGLETAQIYLYNASYYDVAATTLQIFDSPHNELLQIFFSVGPIGLISYMGTIVAPLILAAKSKKYSYRPYLIAFAMMGLCHLFECTVTIMTPIDTPVWFAFLMVACNLYRNKEKDI